jgi:hypothetical protein
MSGKNLLEGRTGPQTQTIDAVKALLQWKKIASDPLPSEVSLDNGRMVLVLSNKRDAYYCLTAKACSCPAATYHPGQKCKHQRKYFGARSEAEEYQARQRALRAQAKAGSSLSEPQEPAKRLARPPEEDSIKPTGGWIGPNGEKANGPVEA